MDWVPPCAGPSGCTVSNLGGVCLGVWGANDPNPLDVLDDKHMGFGFFFPNSGKKKQIPTSNCY